MSEEFRALWRLAKASLMVLCEQVVSDGKMLKTEDLMGLRATVDKLVMTPSISATRALPSNLGSGEKEGEPLAVGGIANAGVSSNAQQQLRDSVQSSVQSSALTVTAGNTQLWSAINNTTFTSASAVVQSSGEPDGHAIVPQGTAPASATANANATTPVRSPVPVTALTPADHSASTAPAPRKMPLLRRYTKKEHALLNEAFVDCRQNGVRLKESAKRLAGQMNRTTRSILTQLAPSMRCANMPRDQWNEVMRAPMTGQRLSYWSLWRPERSRPHAGGKWLRAAKSAPTPHSETECEESDCEEDVSPRRLDGAGSATKFAAESAAVEDDFSSSASVGNYANDSTARIEATSASASDAHVLPSATQSCALNDGPPSPSPYQESHHQDERMDRTLALPVRPAPIEHSDHDDALPSTDSGQEHPLPAPVPSASSSSVRSQTSCKGPEWEIPGIQVISLAGLQNLYAGRKSPVSGGDEKDDGGTAEMHAQQLFDDGGNSSSVVSAPEDGLEGHGEKSDAHSDHSTARKSEQGSGLAEEPEKVGDPQINAADSPHVALVESAEPRTEHQGVHQTCAADHSGAGALVRSSKRMADDDLTGASSDLGGDAKRHNTSAPEETVPGAVSMPTLASAAAAAARTPLASARSGMLYTESEDATTLTAYTKCMQAESTWSAEMDELAVQLGRTPKALKQRCKDLWWKQLCREQHN